jgi:pimeloyl-ACP methyl ester carboxylesterase
VTVASGCALRAYDEKVLLHAVTLSGAGPACQRLGTGVSHRGRVHDRRMTTDRTRQLLDLPDGRALCFAEWGDPDGFPVVALHGTPGSRLNRHPDEREYAAVGARWITYDRPGYGGSTRLPGRSVVDGVGDVEALADHLGLERFAVTGGSGGGPHSLAVAARLGPRVVRARCAVGVVPYDTEGFDWFAGMAEMNVVEFGWALEGEENLRPNIAREHADFVRRVAEDPADMLGGWEIDEADKAVLARSDMAQVIREFGADMAVGGYWGWVDDDLAFTRPWGFDLAEITVPVEVRYGTKDTLVPAAHGEWLAEHVPGATAVVEDDEGHMGDPDQVGRLVGWLVTGRYPD